MSDRILKEAYDKLKAIEEGAGSATYSWELGDHDLGEQAEGSGTLEEMIKMAGAFAAKYTDLSNPTAIEVNAKEHWLIAGSADDYGYEDDELDGNMLEDGRYIIGSYTESVTEASDDSLNDKAVEMLDDALAGLDKNDQYGEKGDILRYILKILQSTGLGK